MSVHSLIVKIFLFQAIQFNQTVLIQTIQFRIGMQFSFILPIDRILSYSGPELTWEWWQWSVPSYSPKFLHHWNFTIWLFSVISRTLVGCALYLCIDAVDVFYNSSRLSKLRMNQCLCYQILEPAFSFFYVFLFSCLICINAIYFLEYYAQVSPSPFQDFSMLVKYRIRRLHPFQTSF